jgi:ankyrin repeat protein
VGPPEIVDALLDAGADPRMRGFGGMSPLHAAALSGQSEIARMLVERGAEVDALDNLGRTPLLTYASGAVHNPVILQILLKGGANPNAADQSTDISVLDYVAIQGHANEAELLVTAGANVNARDNRFGETPLHFATDCFEAAVGNLEMVRFLIAHGADVNAKDGNGVTPLGYVRRCAPNSGLMVEVLTKAGGH